MALITRILKGISLFFYFNYEVLMSSIRVAQDVLTTRPRARPGILAIPLDVKTDLGITAFANFISLTPGSLSLDVTPDRRVLYIHNMFISDPDGERASLKCNVERRIREVFE